MYHVKPLEFFNCQIIATIDGEMFLAQSGWSPYLVFTRWQWRPNRVVRK